MSIQRLGIGDYGANAASALESLRKMKAFHLECLEEEGRTAPQETDESKGVFIRVRIPVPRRLGRFIPEKISAGCGEPALFAFGSEAAAPVSAMPRDAA